MSDKTKIEWTDATWNPVTGCDKVSPGCDHCYAETIAHRFAGTPAYPNGFGVTLRPERLDQPLRWRRPRRVFVNSMSDLFHNDIPDEFIAQVFAVMALAPRHTFQILTKRHGRMRSLLNNTGFNLLVWDAMLRLSDDFHDGVVEVPWPLPNVWLGVSVEDQQRADLRIPALLDTPAAVRFLSCEPLLGPVLLCRCDGAAYEVSRYPFLVDERCGLHGNPAGIDWVIVGGESGPGARPMHPEWARSLRDQCVAAGVAFHFKQWGSTTCQHGEGDNWAWSEPEGWVCTDGRVAASEQEILDDAGHWTAFWRVNKRAAGREFDGQTWDEFPREATA